MTKILQSVAELLTETDALIILAGAGMSADSGIPTYRGEDGSWGKLEKEMNRNVTDIMTPEFIQANPVFMWKRFSKGMEHTKHIKPHLGYHLLLKWINHFKWPYFVVTSNVDRQFAKAHYQEERIYEVHGSGGFLQCTVPCWDQVWQSDYSVYSHVKELNDDNLPRCPNCGSLVRPNVYIFRDRTFVNTRVKKQKENFEFFLNQNQDKRITVLEVGSGPTIKTIRSVTRRLVIKYQAQIVRINIHHAEIDLPHISLPMGALKAFQQIDELLSQRYLDVSL